VSAPQAIRVIFARMSAFPDGNSQGTDQGLHGRDGPAQAAG
jgi:hypothetical protein